MCYRCYECATDGCVTEDDLGVEKVCKAEAQVCFVGVGEFQCTMTSFKFYQRIQAIVSCGQCFPRKESELFALPLDLNNAQCSMKINA